MSSGAVPYIGRKISLVSNSELRYEGILYTINTQESTIALQSVRCFGTEGRKMPEIPPSSEVYDFIIFRGQDIKDLTVLESMGPSPATDPAIVSINRKPPGKDGKGKGASEPSHSFAGKSSYAGKGNAAATSIADSWGGKGSGGWGTGSNAAPQSSWNDGWSSQGQSKGVGKTASSWSSDYGARGGSGYGNSYGSGYGASGQSSYGYGYGSNGAYGDHYSNYGSYKGGTSSSYGSYGQKSSDTTKGTKGSSKGISSDKGWSSGKAALPGKGYTQNYSVGKAGGYGKGYGKYSSKDGRSSHTDGIPVGELRPEENAATKREFALEFDVEAANEKFDKALLNESAAGLEEKYKPLDGYDKKKSFFDSISCEATERSGTSDRQKIDRDKAREFDRDTFGDTRRPPRPIGGKGRR